MNRDDYTAVGGGNGTTWEPKQTGKKKDNNLVALAADENSWVQGYYLGTEHDQGPDKNSQVHKLKLVKAGNPAHLAGDPTDTNGEISIWGTGVLNDKFTKVPVGTSVIVEWKGKQKPKKQSGREYHGWELLQNPNDTIDSGNAFKPSTEPAPAVAPTSEAAPVEGAPAVAGAPAVNPEDDLPF